MTTAWIALALLGTACSDYNVSKQDPVPAPTDAPQPTDAPVPTPPPTSAPDIVVDRLELNFGTYPIDCTATSGFLISNAGDAPLDIDSIVLGSATDAFSMNGTPALLAPGETMTVEVQFRPDSTAFFQDGIVITSNDPDEAVVQLALFGEGDLSSSLTEQFVQQGSAVPVDILFVIDNSTSMGDENFALRNNFNAFIQNFLTLNLDFQIGVVTTDMQTPGDIGALQGPIISTSTPDPIAQFNQNTNVPFTSVMEEQGLDAAFTALSAPLINSTNAGLVRPDSLLSIIIISDEDDQSVITPAEMISFLDSYQSTPDQTSLSIVGGPRAGIFPCGSFFFGAAPVPTYWEVAQATGGIHLNLCNLDMSTIVQQLAVVAAGLSTEFELTTPPPDPNQITVTVDGAVVPEDVFNGWTYNAANNSIVFAGTGIPVAGAAIEVNMALLATCP